MLIYVNGEYVSDKEAVISPYDHGFLYGLGVFETFRVYSGHPFLFDDHYERLLTALSFLHIEWHMEKKELLQILHELLERNGIEDAYVRLNVSAGTAEVGLQTDPYYAPSVIMFMKPLPVTDSTPEKKGIILQVPRNTPEGPFRLKSHHYLNNILGKREVGNDPKKEGIFLTKEGYVAEGIVSNIFFVKQGVLYTPSVETGILNGITRAFVLRLAKSIGVQTRIGFFAKEELLKSDEVFVTNSIQEIVPMHGVGSASFPGKEGEVTAKLIHAYRIYRHILWSKNEITKGD
ncbi:aminodeoxychorismate lyase [Ectobacillus panaciterrae]|uniref:aminodeoxychorismate lyase n=1 Tax=Ectobacillus panaciterrae TaxID=363872 RepID=UPI0003F9DBB7|nr:aminodeoxychorismate lyase [Ectobacillus panaciterrae]